MGSKPLHDDPGHIRASQTRQAEILMGSADAIQQARGAILSWWLKQPDWTHQLVWGLGGAGQGSDGQKEFVRRVQELHETCAKSKGGHVELESVTMPGMRICRRCGTLYPR